jgi:hypothetical protein
VRPPGIFYTSWAQAHNRSTAKRLASDELATLAREVTVQSPELIERMKHLLGE